MLIYTAALQAMTAVSPSTHPRLLPFPCLFTWLIILLLGFSSLPVWMQVLLERIAALEAMTQQAPIVSGSYTPAPFLHLAQPLHSHMSAAMQSQLRLGRYWSDSTAA